MVDTWPEDETGAEVWLQMPDGAPILAQLLAWVREADGAWWAEVGLSLWARIEDGEQLTAEPYPVRLAVPHHLLDAVEGVDYRRVPRRTVARRLTHHRRAGLGAQPEAGPRLVEQRLPRGENSTDPGRIIHRAGCWVSGSDDATISAVQARTLLAEGEAASCPACEAARLLEFPQ
ncbi:DUF6233 domain-containing protein [Streptomyces aculeolatus]